MNIKIDLNHIKKLKEFSFNAFLHRIIDVLVLQNDNNELCDLLGFLKIMRVFCYETSVEEKKEFMFGIYDKEKTGMVPIVNLKNILTSELFVRSHDSEVESARFDAQSQSQIRSSYSDKVMKDVMLEIMAEYDTDDNKKVDLDEFMQIVSDSDVDMLLSLY